MNRKSIIVCTVLILALLSFVTYALCNLFGDEEAGAYEEVMTNSDSKVDVLCAIPTDAILLMESDKENLYFLNENTNFYKALEKLPKAVRKYKNALSIHYTAKNELSCLYVLSLPVGEDLERIREQVLDSFTQLERRQKQTTVYTEISSGVCLAFWNNFLLISHKQTLLESSLRHLSEEMSILDLDGFARLTHMVSGSTRIYVNHQYLGKLFSGAVNRNYLKYADFARTLADWGMASVSQEKGLLKMKGSLTSMKGSDSYISVLSEIGEKTAGIYEHIPSTSTFIFNMTFTKVQDYLNRYRLYLESVKKYRDNPQSVKWLDSLDLKAISLVDIPLKNTTERIMFLELGNKSHLNIPESVLTPFSGRDRINALFGDFFQPTRQDFCCILDDRLVVGSEEAVNYMIHFSDSEIYRNFKDFAEELTLSSVLPKKSGVSLIISPLAYRDQLPELFQKKMSDLVESNRVDINTEYVYLNLVSKGKDRTDFEYYDIKENLQQLPSHINTKGYYEEEDIDDTYVVPVPHGPFKVRNFHTQLNNTLRTTAKGEIQLLDHKNRIVRKYPFKEQICGCVELIDYLKNGKKQAIFAAGSRLYLMDRLGRWVSGFPKELEKEVLLGPAVYDFNADRNYRLVVLHRDNSIQMYDVEGQKYSSWSEIQLKEKIKGLPELLKANERIYWIVRTTRQLLIYDDAGTIVADFSKKKRVSPDSKVVRESEHELLLTSTDGGKLLLNLRKGTLKRI